MQYLAAFLEQKAPDVADFSITLESIPNASKGVRATNTLHARRCAEYRLLL